MEDKLTKMDMLGLLSDNVVYSYYSAEKYYSEEFRDKLLLFNFLNAYPHYLIYVTHLFPREIIKEGIESFPQTKLYYKD